MQYKIHPLVTTAALSALLFVGAMPAIGLAQTTAVTTPPTATDTPVPATTTTTTDQNHHDTPWGLFGLLGLAGLAGLRRRDDTTVVRPR